MHVKLSLATQWNYPCNTAPLRRGAYTPVRVAINMITGIRQYWNRMRERSEDIAPDTAEEQQNDETRL